LFTLVSSQKGPAADASQGKKKSSLELMLRRKVGESPPETMNSGLLEDQGGKQWRDVKNKEKGGPGLFWHDSNKKGKA